MKKNSKSENTMTQETVNNAFAGQNYEENTQSLKNYKVQTPREKRINKEKKKKLIRNLMTIPEIIILIIIVLVLRGKYIKYSKDAHQTLTYTSGDYVYIIKRDSTNITVIKNERMSCIKEPCEEKKLSEYSIQFDKNKMKLLRLFMDIQFKFKNGSKNITMKDIKSDFGKICMYSIINNQSSFLETKTFKSYTIVDFEQISKYEKRGYKYVIEDDRKMLYIAMGERKTSGYELIVNRAFKKGDDLYFYVIEQSPDDEKTASSVITHPLIQIELDETPKNFYIYNIESGEEYPNYDALEIPNPTPSIVSERVYIGDLIGTLVEG